METTQPSAATEKQTHRFTGTCTCNALLECMQLRSTGIVSVCVAGTYYNVRLQTKVSERMLEQ